DQEHRRPQSFARAAHPHPAHRRRGRAPGSRAVQPRATGRGGLRHPPHPPAPARATAPGTEAHVVVRLARPHLEEHHLDLLTPPRPARPTKRANPRHPGGVPALPPPPAVGPKFGAREIVATVCVAVLFVSGVLAAIVRSDEGRLSTPSTLAPSGGSSASTWDPRVA